MKVPQLDPEVTGSYKRTLNTAVLIWVMNAPARRRQKPRGGRLLVLTTSGSLGLVALVQVVWHQLVG
ncbi:hypothetical protein MHY85_10445 [Cellulomonas sp. ACRRI]|uniref:hypothetical protein n=1 Tax=Cellulomonas sp. ACRRI TaxID=2918188 RepID=UPI001EF38A75|nr:hypothetical protein [Cellulomonas sp. ACRRI]MCG7286387.1 hypothetical protein [Cellulomonas sp. ACRRI]